MPSLREVLENFTAVVVTGGSSGVGKSFIELVRRLERWPLFCNLSRRSPDIPEAELKLRHNLSDLSEVAQLAGSRNSLASLLNREAPEGRVLLIDNNRFGTYGRLLESKIDPWVEMIDVNIRALITFTAHLVRSPVQQGVGAATEALTTLFQATPQLAVYKTRKVFFLHWTLAFNGRLRGKNVGSLAVRSRPTSTGFALRAGRAGQAVFAREGQMPRDLASNSFLSWCSGGAALTIGGSNRLLASLRGWIPQPWSLLSLA